MTDHELLEADDLGTAELTEWERDRLEQWAAEIELGRETFLHLWRPHDVNIPVPPSYMG